MVNFNNTIILRRSRSEDRSTNTNRLQQHRSNSEPGLRSTPHTRTSGGLFAATSINIEVQPSISQFPICASLQQELNLLALDQDDRSAIRLFLASSVNSSQSSIRSSGEQLLQQMRQLFNLYADASSRPDVGRMMEMEIILTDIQRNLTTI